MSALPPKLGDMGDFKDHGEPSPPPVYASLRRLGRIELGLHATIALDGSSPGHPRKLAELRRGWEVPPKFLSSVLGRLCQCNVIASSRGAQGGYWLTRPLDEIKVVEVVDA